MMSEKKKNLIVRSITGVLFVAIVVTCFFTPIGMLSLFTLVTGMTTYEYCTLINENTEVEVNRFITTAASAYFFVAMAGWCTGITPAAAFIPYLLTIVYLFIAELFTKAANPISNWAYTMLAQMYIALPFSMIVVLAFSPSSDSEAVYNYLLPLSVFIFLWVNDSGAYLTGSLFGRHKLFPRVSPGKSWEGSIGGAVFVIIAAIIISLTLGSQELDNGRSMLVWIGLGLIVVVFGTLGDLVESLFKRTLGIKDSGTILPGHGGMLDRFDSSLMAFPAAVVYLYTLSLF